MTFGCRAVAPGQISEVVHVTLEKEVVDPLFHIAYVQDWKMLSAPRILPVTHSQIRFVIGQKHKSHENVTKELADVLSSTIPL